MLRTQQYIYVAWAATPATILPRRTPMSLNTTPTPFPMNGRSRPVSHTAALAFAKTKAITKIGPIRWLVPSMTCTNLT
ncbi:hypothetical protein B0H19DRAFT_1203814 [Mycena capillaripes]|nr:hypothetical protein B0H19DRAFT_1203814 [Mycena capillaripes]